MNHQNNRGRPGKFRNSLRNAGCKGFWGHGTDSPTVTDSDRFIAGHSNCDLRRHLDSTPPETPIRDVVDRCRVWESHADPAVRRMSKPAPDPTYPAYTVGDTDGDNEITRVAAVTGLNSDQNRLIDLIRCIISSAERPTPKPEISDKIGRLQQLVREPPNRAPVVVNPPVPKTLEQMLRSLLDGQRQRQRQPLRQRQQRRDWTDIVCFSCGKLGHAATRCPDFNEAFPFLQPGQTAGGRKTTADTGAKVRLPGQYARLAPGPRRGGGGTVSTDPPRWSILNDVPVDVEQPREEPSLVSSKHSTLQTGQALAEDTHRQECPHDVIGLHVHKGTMWMPDDCVPLKNVLFPVAPALLVDEPQLDSWQVAVIRVDETPAGDSSEQDSPWDTQNRHRPVDTDSIPNSLAHIVVQGGPVGPQGIEPLGLLVRDHADPAGQHAVIQNNLLGPAGP